MPAAQVIGRVAVKVLPDTSKFRGDAQRELNKIEKALKVHVDAQINESALKRSALQAVNNLNKHLRTNNAYLVRFRATIAKTTLPQAISKASRDMEALAKKEPIKFNADIAATIAEVQAKLEQTSLDKVEHELKDWADDISPLNVNVATTMLTGATAYVSARLRVLTRPRTVEIIPKVNNSAFAAAATAIAALSGGRVLSDTLDNLWDRLKRLDKAVPIIGTVAEAIAGLSAYLLTAASNMFALAQSLAQMGMASLALPGILGGIAIGIGATVAVLKDFNTVLPDVADKFHKLQDQMSDNFWEKAKKPISDMIDNLFPQFAAGLKKTSTELGNFFANLATHLDGQFDNALQGMFDDLSESIAVAGRHTEAYATILRVLGEVGAGYLPRLAAWVGDLSDKFAKWLSDNQKSGQIFEWIELGITQIKEFGRALGNIGGILHGLADAANAAGGSTLSMFADTLQRVEDTVKGATFQRVLVDALRAAHEAMSTISEISGPAVETFFEKLGETATRVFPLMGNTVGTALKAIFGALSQAEVSNGLVAMFAGLNVAVAALAPVMPIVGQALGELMRIIGALAQVIGPVMAVAFAAFADIIIKLSGPIQTIIGLLGGGLLSIVESLAPVLSDLGSKMSDTFTKIGPALVPIIAFVTQLAAAVLPLLMEGISQVLTKLEPLIAKLGELFEVVGPVLIPILTFLAGVLIDMVVMAIDGVINVISGAIDIFMGLVNFITGVFTGNWSQAWDGIKQIFTGIWELIVGAFELFLSVGILGVGGKILTSVKSFFKNIWDDIWRNLKGLWDNIGGSFRGLMHDLKQTGTSLMTAIKNFFTSIWRDLVTFFRKTWNDISGIFGGAISGVKNLVTGGFNAVKNFIDNAMSGAKNLVKGAWDGIKSFFSGGKDDVIAKVKEIPSAIKNIFSNAGSLLLDAGKAIVKGFISGIGSMFGAVKDKLGSLTSKLTSWKGPENVDRVLLHDAGRLVIDGFINGLESRYDAVRKSLKGLTTEVGSMSVDAPSVNGSRSAGLTAQLAAVVNGNSSDGIGRDGKTFNYYAAPGSSIDSEEDLFAAVNRARMVGW